MVKFKLLSVKLDTTNFILLSSTVAMQAAVWMTHQYEKLMKKDTYKQTGHLIQCGTPPQPNTHTHTHPYPSSPQRKCEIACFPTFLSML